MDGVTVALPKNSNQSVAPGATFWWAFVARMVSVPMQVAISSVSLAWARSTAIVWIARCKVWVAKVARAFPFVRHFFVGVWNKITVIRYPKAIYSGNNGDFIDFLRSPASQTT